MTNTVIKNHSWFFIFIFALALVGYLLSVDSLKGAGMAKLILSIKLENTVYRSGEAVRALVSLTNSGTEEIVVNKRMAANFSNAPELVRDVAFTVKGPTDQLLPFIARVNVRPVKHSDFIILSPGETIVMPYELGTLYDLRDSGRYSIYAEYQNAIDPDRNITAWKGKLKSNEVVFEVIPP